MVLTIVVRQGRRNPRRGLRVARVGCLEDLYGLLFEVRKRRWHFTEGQGLVDAALRQFERVRGAVVAIDTLHFVYWEILHRLASRTFGQVFSFLTCCGIVILNPWDALALPVCGCESNLRSIAKVRAVDTPDFVSPNEHCQDGLRFGVGFIVCILELNAQKGSTELIWPMAQLASLAGRHKPAGFQC